MTLLIGALTIGLILSLLALGVLISFRIFHFPDITADGSITFGASVAAVMLVAGFNPIISSAAGFGAGFIAGALTGILHTKFKINGLLAGILVMTALYSVNLHVMGKSNVPLMSARTLSSMAESAGAKVFGASENINLFGWEVGVRDISSLTLIAIAIIIAGIILYAFFRTNVGTAMRATGDNDQMIRALGVNVDTMIIAGLALSNGLIGLSGALLAQYQGFADVQMGIGMVVWGLASVIIGEALVRTQSLGLTITGAVMGSVLFRLMVAIALRWGLNPNDLKLITAVFVFVALILPNLLGKVKSNKARNIAMQTDKKGKATAAHA
ncbi:MAG TPA: ABC transporter permease [Blastocatellia bacterium]|nr:ABC transporter permease [Blastocatellia bacterium]